MKDVVVVATVTSSSASPRPLLSSPSRLSTPCARPPNGTPRRIPRAKTSSTTSRQHAQGGVPAEPVRGRSWRMPSSVLRQTYHVAYVQHAPLEPRAAVAEWKDGKLTVWTGTQNPVRLPLRTGARLPPCREASVRRHRARFRRRLRRQTHRRSAASKPPAWPRPPGSPVSLRWTRQEEFTWAYFRPAAVIHIEAGLDDQGRLTSWHFVNINSGGAARRHPLPRRQEPQPVCALRRPPAPGLLPRPGRHRQQLRPRIFHG